jgi:hypothetical protein
MKFNIIAASVMTLCLCACAGTASQEGQTARGDVRVSQGVRKIVDEEGEVVATETVAADADKNAVRCRREYPVGSHRAKTICYTVGEIEDTSERTRDVMDRKMKGACPGGVACPGGN